MPGGGGLRKKTCQHQTGAGCTGGRRPIYLIWKSRWGHLPGRSPKLFVGDGRGRRQIALPWGACPCPWRISLMGWRCMTPHWS